MPLIHSSCALIKAMIGAKEASPKSPNSPPRFRKRDMNDLHALPVLLTLISPALSKNQLYTEGPGE